MFIPPVGLCGVCHKPLAVTYDRTTVTFRVFRAGKLDAEQAGETYACSSAHAAELLRRLAGALDEANRPAVDAGEWAARFGVVATKAG